MERISGPYGPYYVAAYAVEGDDGHFHGYAKICVAPPEDVWLAEAVDKVAAPPQASAIAALHAAEDTARHCIELRRMQWPSEWGGE